MPKSKARKPKTHTARPAPRTMREVSRQTPGELLEQLALSTAQRVLEGLKVLEHLAIDFPDTEGINEARLAYKVASLSLVELVQDLNGDIPFRELVAREEQEQES